MKAKQTQYILKNETRKNIFENIAEDIKNNINSRESIGYEQSSFQSQQLCILNWA